MSEAGLKVRRDSVNPDCAGADQLHAKLDVIRIRSYRSPDFPGAPCAGHHGMISHVVAERRGAILPVNPYKQPRNTPFTPGNPYERSIYESLATVGRGVEVLIKK